MNNSLLLGLQQFQQWLANEKVSSIFYLFDDNTLKHCKPHIPDSLLQDATSMVVPHGEDHKTIASCAELWQQLINKGADRHSILINVGGGMLTDLGGFAAATFKRGIRFVNVPTTLLAMVDASIGNKTGVNFREIKNQIGTFSPAEKIVIDPLFLSTLSDREWLSGMGEVLKYGLIYRDHLWKQALLVDRNKLPEQLIQNCIQIKLEVVSQDPKEHGIRQILNFGHTIGHGLEAYSHHIHNPLSHGAAVALGMAAEAYLSQEVLDFTELDEVVKGILSLYDIPSWLSALEDMNTLLGFIRQDKKNVNGQIHCTLLKAIGSASVGHILTEKQVEDSIQWLGRQA